MFFTHVCRNRHLRETIIGLKKQWGRNYVHSNGPSRITLGQPFVYFSRRWFKPHTSSTRSKGRDAKAAVLNSGCALRGSGPDDVTLIRRKKMQWSPRPDIPCLIAWCSYFLLYYHVRQITRPINACVKLKGDVFHKHLRMKPLLMEKVIYIPTFKIFTFVGS